MSAKKNFDINTVLAERSYIKPTEDTEMNLDVELEDHFDECGRISLLSEARTPLLPLKTFKAQSQPSLMHQGGLSDRYIPLRQNQYEIEAQDLLLDISLDDSGAKPS